MKTNIRLKLRNKKLETPEVRKWLIKCEKILNKKVDDFLMDALIYGSAKL
jgi:hypothetical protein